MFWYITEFHPYQDDLNEIIETAKAELGNDTEQIYLLATIIETKQGILNFSSRQTFYYLSYQHKSQERSNSSWHLNLFLWYQTLDFLYSDEEIFYLWSHFSIFHGGWKINDTALKTFGKPITKLDLTEQITVFVMVKRPAYFKLGSKALDTRVNYFLEKYQEEDRL